MGQQESGTSNDWKDCSQRTVSDFRWHNFPGRMCLELFSGSGRLTQSLNALGTPSFGIDIVHGSEDDVLNPRIEKKIRKLLFSGSVVFLWIGMPCTTFSIARKLDGIGPGPLRSDEHPMGLPKLLPNDRKKVLEGNRLLAVSYRLILLCQQLKVPWCLENPATSRCWITPLLKRIIPHCSSVILDFCQYGEAWRKRTKLIAQFISFHSLNRLCAGNANICSRTGKAHLNLKGTNQHGQFWTRVAQPYPFALVSELATLIFEQIFAKRSQSG